jgi:hypothetical protein
LRFFRISGWQQAIPSAKSPFAECRAGPYSQLPATTLGDINTEPKTAQETPGNSSHVQLASNLGSKAITLKQKETAKAKRPRLSAAQQEFILKSVVKHDPFKNSRIKNNRYVVDHDVWQLIFEDVSYLIDYSSN